MDLSEEIDWKKLIDMTDGYSGADITSVCREAAMMPMRKKLSNISYNILNEINNLQKDIDVPLTMPDFLEAIKNISKSVS